MSDLIDRQSAINALHEWELLYDWDQTCRENRERVYAPSEVIEDLPTAEPKIVRCKDCKFSEHWYRDRRRCFLWVEDGISVFDDGFCNYAERKEDG